MFGYHSQSCDVEMRHGTGTRLSYDFTFTLCAHDSKMRDTNYVTGRPRMESRGDVPLRRMDPAAHPSINVGIM